ncbi:hypothetical protein QLL95_gp0203 [Cotonvirus japonicus]|uniref:Uncharacterized protein n=1 Tax=Cotonvirus japonicus TaxID=2811091 RepID=A0ABM7NRA4_9VIRU|nr:hypothetical protein QLL95_gp0203 [Cotonvirus japonicus]BCS82692.1 hypothetical protein [Cotonvirus japonicus]
MPTTLYEVYATDLDFILDNDQDYDMDETDYDLDASNELHLLRDDMSTSEESDDLWTFQLGQEIIMKKNDQRIATFDWKPQTSDTLGYWSVFVHVPDHIPQDHPCRDYTTRNALRQQHNIPDITRDAYTSMFQDQSSQAIGWNHADISAEQPVDFSAVIEEFKSVWLFVNTPL